MMKLSGFSGYLLNPSSFKVYKHGMKLKLILPEVIFTFNLISFLVKNL